jgi:hypothetical protein
VFGIYLPATGAPTTANKFDAISAIKLVEAMDEEEAEEFME